MIERRLDHHKDEGCLRKLPEPLNGTVLDPGQRKGWLG